MKVPTTQTLRAHAISHSLFKPTFLKNAINQLKFVQADPIRSPARAQDLILRHRVENYQAGDLERDYPALDLEEDFLYAYGFLTRDVWELLHPRKTSVLSELEQQILETVQKLGEVHPRQMEIHFGNERIVNAWGGFSKATTEILEKLHYRGLVRIARREKGIRIYETKTPPHQTVDSADLVDRLKKLILVIVNIFAPLTVKCLQEALIYYRRWLPLPLNTKNEIAGLLRTGELEKQTVDGIDYLFPSSKTDSNELQRNVRFLAPFDPVVWDRRRFEHFWNWAYRFEAYTPPAKRLRGYYAMPLLWEDDVIGWANVNVLNGDLHCDIGYIAKQPTDIEFKNELEKEVERLKKFLNLKTL